MTYLFHKRSCERQKSNQQKTGDQLEERNLAKLLLWDIQPKPVENASTIQAHIVEANMTIIFFLWYFHILSNRPDFKRKHLLSSGTKWKSKPSKLEFPNSAAGIFWVRLVFVVRYPVHCEMLGGIPGPPSFCKQDHPKHCHIPRPTKWAQLFFHNAEKEQKII